MYCVSAGCPKIFTGRVFPTLSPSVFVPLMFLLTLAAIMQSLSVQGAVEQVHDYLSCDDECLNCTHKSGTQPDVCSGWGRVWGWFGAHITIWTMVSTSWLRCQCSELVEQRALSYPLLARARVKLGCIILAL